MLETCSDEASMGRGYSESPMLGTLHGGMVPAVSGLGDREGPFCTLKPRTAEADE